MGSAFDKIGDLLGASPNNAGFTAQGANILQPTNVGQANDLYNTAQSGIGQQQALVNALAAQNGIQNQSNVFNQLQGVANGTGPNPAQAQLNQATGQNVQNQAALMAGQRGASANPALIARQAAQQGAATQQQAVGQGATLAAQQQLNALGQLGGLASQQVSQQQNALGGLNNAAQNEQSQILNSINSQNNANVASTSNMNNTNQAMAGINANNTAKAIGGLTSGLAAATKLIPAAAPLAALSQGGKVENGKLANVPESDRFQDSLYPSHLKEMGNIYHGQSFKSGGAVKSGKEVVKGDSPKNDNVPALLSKGEFVIPKSIMESDDPIAGASKMIADYQKKNGKGNDDKMKGDFKAALQRAITGRKNK